MLLKIEEDNIINTDHIISIQRWTSVHKIIHLVDDKNLVVSNETADKLIKFLGYRDLEKISQNGEQDSWEEELNIII